MGSPILFLRFACTRFGEDTFHHDHLSQSRQYNEATEGPARRLQPAENPEVAEAGLSLAVYEDMREGFTI